MLYDACRQVEPWLRHFCRYRGIRSEYELLGIRKSMRFTKGTTDFHLIDVIRTRSYVETGRWHLLGLKQRLAK